MGPAIRRFGSPQHLSGLSRRPKAADNRGLRLDGADDELGVCNAIIEAMTVRRPRPAACVRHDCSESQIGDIGRGSGRRSYPYRFGLHPYLLKAATPRSSATGAIDESHDGPFSTKSDGYFPISTAISRLYSGNLSCS